MVYIYKEISDISQVGTGVLVKSHRENWTKYICAPSEMIFDLCQKGEAVTQSGQVKGIDYSATPCGFVEWCVGCARVTMLVLL